ncbi:MAG: tripartite tricarboxylate transporter substrate binding protein [Burkholderiales bacterium]|nr:MAG: tripartite tricarboxylate transporter substrate binding protein [Burkholderiales bacterium]
MVANRRQVMQALAAVPLAASGIARAQSTSSRPLRIVVPASPGTSIDAVTRFFVEPLSKRLNVPVVVENRSGAGGLLGYQQVARSTGDGNIIMLTGIPLYLIPLFSDLTPSPFDALKDFSPVARVARVSYAIVVAPDSPYKTMGDLLGAMRAKPGEITYSSQGVGSSAHLCSAVLADMSKTKAQHIGYKETTMAVTDVAGGRVSFTCQTSVGTVPLIQGGKLRALAVTSSKRWDALPGVPTVDESGVPGFGASSQLDFMAPAQVPEARLKLLSDEILAIAQTPAFQEFCAKQLLLVDVMSAKELGPEMGREAVRWKKVAELVRA